MNPLQSGTPASAITPQGYKNSSQNGNFQGGFSGSDLLESSSVSYALQANPSQKLSVETNSRQSVLGVSRTTSAGSSAVASSDSGINLFFPVTLILVSAVLALYFIRKFREFASVVDVLDDTAVEE